MLLHTCRILCRVSTASDSMSHCEGVGCTRSRHLTYVHGGWFCERHAERLQYIRYQLRHTSSARTELMWRQKERLVRGMDPGHDYRIKSLEQSLTVTHKQTKPRRKLVEYVPDTKPVTRFHVMAPGLIFVS